MVFTWITTAIISLVLGIVSLLALIVCLIKLGNKKSSKKEKGILIGVIVLSLVLLVTAIFFGTKAAQSISEGRFLEKDENGLYEMKYEEYADSPYEKEMIEKADQVFLEATPNLNQIYDDISKGILHVYKIKGEIKIVRRTPEAIYIEGVQTDDGSEHKAYQSFLPNSFLAQHNIG